MPKILPANSPFLQLYLFCSDQYIVSAGGAIGLNLIAVDKAMDYFNIDQDERVEFYEKVRLIAGKVLSLQYKDQEAKRKASSNK